ncbi:neutral/alkaline non-lysosomal ceramidase N-terminal domain-containing protein [Niabella drilacis]|uniref:Neutral/alkaline non-lysosomal ceramidase, N-terminal n=1 Tax=Niabella drilacis (strain DSM 25811 / CCM 8410 / CCUG 62505 / LMG 26954 / E90) TaxID=1285928 RepID=A0A1G6LUT7_NIADE|nr:neutral/alkaline non-lysosomal ceramidase N-terminal domain-containing protein [Niabella drilacis]SDC47068.1 Neutral/alkaline non-lysosomal ceramidase, N-terminal [Niabella drilacis]
MIKAGAFATDITPRNDLQLAGYPFVERRGTGVHDPLLASVLYIHNGETALLFVSCDLIYIGRDLALRICEQVQERHGIPRANIMITATHTHSGPATVTFIAGAHDALQQPVDEGYLSFLEERIMEAVLQAIVQAGPAAAALVKADATGIGTNRHSPEAASDLKMPVLMVRRKADLSVIACMVVCCMHPTVLHEDSTLYSGDFPGVARQILQQYFSKDTVFLFQLGTAGNQSPRHVTTGNTFGEAGRLAGILATAITTAIRGARYQSDLGIRTAAGTVKLVRKTFPLPADARDYVATCQLELDSARAMGLTPQEVRSREVNWFGAREMAYLSQLVANGALEETYRKTEQAEILIFKTDLYTFIGWPGEIFVEYGLEIKEHYPDAAVITLVNGELQGYIVTPEAAAEGVYEASNAVFDPSCGALLVAKTKALLNSLQ